jgi:transposase
MGGTKTTFEASRPAEGIREPGAIACTCGCQESRKLRCVIAQLVEALEKANAENRFLRQTLYGRSSEKGTEDSPSTRGTKESGVTGKPKKGTGSTRRKRGAQEGHTGHGRTVPDEGKAEDVVHAIPEASCFCEECRAPWNELPLENESYEIDIEVRYFWRRHRQKKYKPTCTCGSRGIITAPGPLKIFPRGKFSIPFWVELIVNKYEHGLPICRQVRMMALHGLTVAGGTLSSGLMRMHDFVFPLYELFGARLVDTFLIHADETRWMNWSGAYDPDAASREDEKKRPHRHWLWCFASKRYVVYVIDPSRSKAVVDRTLGESPDAIICCDRYAVYLSIQGLLAFCWAHVRRDFLRIQTRYPDHRDRWAWAQQWLDWIDRLFALDPERIAGTPGWKTKMQAVLDEMECLFSRPWRDEIKRKQAESMQAHWLGLTLFMEDRRIPLDNNRAERLLRGPVVGRKNYYGVHSDRGSEMAAIFFTLLATCRENAINPRAYLTRYLEACAREGGAPAHLENYLPEQYAELYPEDLLESPP